MKKHLATLLLTLTGVLGVSSCASTTCSVTCDPSSTSIAPPASEDPSTSVVDPSSSSSSSSSSVIEESEEYEVIKGAFNNDDGVLTSGDYGSLLIFDRLIESGSYSVTMKIADKYFDNGIIFGYDDNSHYFFGFNLLGDLFISRITNGTSELIKNFGKKTVAENGEFVLDVYFDKENGYVETYFDKEFLGSFSLAFNSTNKVGLSSGGKNTMYSKIIVKDNISISDNDFSSYHVAFGAFSEQDGYFVSGKRNSLLINDKKTFKIGTLEATIKLSGACGDDGLVFGLSDGGQQVFWENKASYYFFFVSLDGLAYLGKVNNGTWTMLKARHIYDYQTDKSYNIKVVRDAKKIHCYVDDLLYFSYIDATPLSGNKFGIRCKFGNIKFNNIRVLKYDGFLTSLSEEISSTSFIQTGNVLTANANHSYAFLSEEHENGTYVTHMAPNSVGNSGIVFHYSKEGVNESYYKFHLNDSGRVALLKVVEGTSTIIDTKFLSNGGDNARGFKFKVVMNGNKFHCYLDDRCCFVYSDETPLSGNKFGVYGAIKGVSFEMPSYSSSTEIETAETLIFGHSYTEFWYDYKSDFKEFPNINDIGYGASTAADWVKYKDEVASYNMKQGIYWIGINDLTFNMTPETCAQNVRELLLHIKSLVPEFEVALVAVNYCNAREEGDYRTRIHQTNVLYMALAEEFSWIKYVDVESLYCNDLGQPIGSYFTDGLHPNKEGYLIAAKLIAAALGK